MAWYRPWDRQGNVARDRRESEIAERTMWEQRTADPYGENPPQWDSAGFPVGPMPRGKYSLDYQYEANRRAEMQRRTLWGDAQNSMRQGLNLLQSYRPGGSAALASGQFGQKAGLYANQALNTEAPDLLIDFREQARKRAEENANEFNRNSQLITGLSALNILGGTAAQMVPAAPTPTEGIPKGDANSTIAVGSGEGAAAGLAGGNALGGTGGGQPMGPVGGGGGAGLGAILPGGLGGGAAMGATAGATLGAEGGGTAAGGGGGGGGGRARGGGGGAAGGGGGGAEGGGGMGGARAGGGGGTDMSPPGVAQSQVAQAPIAFDATSKAWVNDPLRGQSTALRVASARKALLRAMDLDAGMSGLSDVELAQPVPSYGDRMAREADDSVYAGSPSNEYPPELSGLSTRELARGVPPSAQMRELQMNGNAARSEPQRAPYSINNWPWMTRY